MVQKPKSRYLCGREGHIVRCVSSESVRVSRFFVTSVLFPPPLVCYLRILQSRGYPESFYDSTGGFGGGYSGTEWYRCGKMGHITRVCPEADGGSQKTWCALPHVVSESYCSADTFFLFSVYFKVTRTVVGHLSCNCGQGSMCYNFSAVVNTYSFPLFEFDLASTKPGHFYYRRVTSAAIACSLKDALATRVGQKGACPL